MSTNEEGIRLVMDTLSEVNATIQAQYAVPLEYSVPLWSQSWSATSITFASTATGISLGRANDPVVVGHETCPDRHVFRPGDRVVVTARVSDNSKIKAGMTGTVLYVAGYNGWIGVRFDKMMDGHNGLNQGMTCMKGYGWYVSKKEIKYLGRRVNPAHADLRPRTRKRRRVKKKGVVGMPMA